MQQPDAMAAPEFSEEQTIRELSELAVRRNSIPPALYGTYNVKRGLRNADGTGVLVGLTNIGAVHGYIIDENEKAPVEGKLFYRGYDVTTLVEGFQNEQRFGFEEICYLLLFGELPTVEALDSFSHLLGRKRSLPQNFTEDMILKNPSASIMNKLARSVLAAYSYDCSPDDISIPNVLRQCIDLIARFPTMVAYGYQALAHYYQRQSLYLHNPDPRFGTAESFLQMIRPNASFTRLEAELLDLALVLHAEHGGGNNSAFVVHVVTSTDTDTYSAVASAVGSLKGPKHGGANSRVVEMIEDMKKTIGDSRDDEEVERYIGNILERQAFDRSGLVYGMGHAVYTLSDPRAVMLRDRARDLAREKGRVEDFDLCYAVERLAPKVLRDKKGVEKPFCANVDLYSGLVYAMLELPPSLYTPLFAISRVAGWCAHRIEELVSGGKIVRPAYKNVMPKVTYVPLRDRR